MTPAEPEALDKPWRFWASVAIISVLAFSVVFGFLILPIMQGRDLPRRRHRGGIARRAPAH
jgi:hypothetical protein